MQFSGKEVSLGLIPSTKKQKQQKLYSGYNIHKILKSYEN